MQKIFERVILALVLVSLVLSVVGLITTNGTLTNIGLVSLMLIAVGYAAIQVVVYVTNNKTEENGKVLTYALVTSVVAIAIVCLGTLMLMGKLTF